MYFDTHAHYDDEAFDADRDALLSALPGAGVTLVVDPGCDVKSSEKALALAERFPHVYAAVGIHPEELAGMEAGDLAKIEALCAHEKCVAIGEIGLDYYWDDTHREEQKALFIEQLELALRHDKPVIIHDREAHGDSLDIVRRYSDVQGVFHCYSGSKEMAEELLKRGWYLGFDGPITYKNARKAIEVLEICPLDRLLIETDSPYLSPVPRRGKRNDSRNLQYIAEKIAEVKGLTCEEVAKISMENGRRLFKI
ncbi:MAG: TatD family hydrolase [Oscillospiraceae bacterium]|nr:TatD family hydrolase [Oscillospiraceae bacterium]